MFNFIKWISLIASTACLTVFCVNDAISQQYNLQKECVSLYEKRDFVKSLKKCQRLLKLMPNSCVAHEYIIRNVFEMGNQSFAREIFVSAYNSKGKRCPQFKRLGNDIGAIIPDTFPTLMSDTSPTQSKVVNCLNSNITVKGSFERSLNKTIGVVKINFKRENDDYIEIVYWIEKLPMLLLEKNMPIQVIVNNVQESFGGYNCQFVSFGRDTKLKLAVRAKAKEKKYLQELSKVSKKNLKEYARIYGKLVDLFPDNKIYLEKQKKYSRKWILYQEKIKKKRIALIEEAEKDQKKKRREEFTGFVKRTELLGVKFLVLNWKWYASEDSRWVRVVGQVYNFSRTRIKDTRVIVSFYDSNNRFIDTYSGMLIYNPIMPSQTSPFKVLAPYNPLMHKAVLTFATQSGKVITSTVCPEKYINFLE